MSEKAKNKRGESRAYSKWLAMIAVALILLIGSLPFTYNWLDAVGHIEI